MTTPKGKFAGLALIAALFAGVTLGLTAQAWAGWDGGVAAPEPEGDGTPRCLTGATFGPIGEDSPLFGGVIRIQVVGVERDSLAWKKGLREHDAVVMVNGELVRDLDEFAAATTKRGGSLILKILSRSFTGAWLYIGSGFFSVVC